jgi:AraC-like DNA-binding protein
MATRDIITDLTDLTHPLPEPPGDNDEPDGWSELCEEVAEDREAYEQRLRLSWEHEDDFDPLLDEIGAARNAMLAAEARMRLLIAYGREFTRPRPYRLEDLARAAGMSISGVRTAYDADEIAEVTRLTGAKPTRRPAEAP